MCLHARRQHNRRTARAQGDSAKSSILHPLLDDQDSSTVELGGRDSVPSADSAAAAGVGADESAGGEEAAYSGDTGAPANAAAEAEVAHAWRSGASAWDGRPLVVELAFKELARATGGFDESRNIGGGASCTVYRGRVFGVEVAVKRLLDGAVEWEAKQYASEMALLIAVSHDHICRLFAFSSDGPSKCLVLELCTGGALDTRLRQPAPVAPTWQHRVRIARQVALALAHLHSIVPKIVHRDVKSANVLLDAAGEAKVADFGTVREGAKTGEHGTAINTHALTGLIVGTKVQASTPPPPPSLSLTAALTATSLPLACPRNRPMPQGLHAPGVREERPRVGQDRQLRLRHRAARAHHRQGQA
jgi:hypothetical protein